MVALSLHSVLSAESAESDAITRGSDIVEDIGMINVRARCRAAGLDWDGAKLSVKIRPVMVTTSATIDNKFFTSGAKRHGD
jgi:hypothetical protein